MTAVYLLLGLLFGYILSRSGAADYNFIQGMFLLTNFQLYGIIGAAVAITAPGLWLLKRYGRTISGAPNIAPPDEVNTKRRAPASAAARARFSEAMTFVSISSRGSRIDTETDACAARW